MLTAPQAIIATKTRIPRPCPPNPAIKLRRSAAPPVQNKTPIRNPQHRSTATSAVLVTPRTSRKSAGIQTTMVVEQPGSDDKLARTCTQCNPKKILENSVSLMFHKTYKHGHDFFCPVPHCSYGPFTNWNSLLGSHLKIQHKQIWEKLRKLKPKNTPFYDKLHKVDRKH